MRYYPELLPALLGVAAIIINVPQAAIALDASEVSEIAKEITVLIDGQNPGSGVIVLRDDNTYTILTAAHVVATPDEYTIVTPDGRRYQLDYDTVRKIPDVDLAIAQFTSTYSYPVAELENSNEIREGRTVYLAGFPNPGREIPKLYHFTTGEVSARPDSPLRDGYALIYK